VSLVFRIGLIADAPEAAPRLREAVRGRALVERYDHVDPLISAVALGQVGLSVLEVRRATSALTLAGIRRLRDAFPAHPIVVWCDLRALDTATLLTVARLDVQELIRADGDDLPHTLARTIANAAQRSVSARIAAELRDLVPPRVRPVFEYALEHAGEHLSRDAVAAGFGISRRTLHNRLVEVGLPPTRPFLTWCRMLVAGAMLDQPGHTLDSIAGQLDFPDGGALGKLVRRYAGCTVNELRDLGALVTLAAAFRRLVSANRTRRTHTPVAAPIE